MTWVIGGTTVFGYGALISDVEVTFSNGVRAPLIQKAFPITQYIAAGFAGSVQIGYRMLHELRGEAALPARQDQAWDPKLVANNFSERARRIFQTFPPAEQKLQCHLLLVGASPTEIHPFGSRVYLIRMVSPHFVPGVMGNSIQACSIGSGARSKELKRIIKPLFRINSGVLQADVGNLGGWGQMLSHSVTMAIRAHPMAGISEHHHHIFVRLGSMTIQTNDMTTHHQNGTVSELRMPPVAKSYPEFLTLASGTGHEAALAVC